MLDLYSFELLWLALEGLSLKSFLSAFTYAFPRSNCLLNEQDNPLLKTQILYEEALMLKIASMWLVRGGAWAVLREGWGDNYQASHWWKQVQLGLKGARFPLLTFLAHEPPLDTAQKP